MEALFNITKLKYIKLTCPLYPPDRIWWIEVDQEGDMGYVGRVVTQDWDGEGLWCPVGRTTLKDKGDVVEEITKDQFEVLWGLAQYDRKKY